MAIKSVNQFREIVKETKQLPRPVERPQRVIETPAPVVKGRVLPERVIETPAPVVKGRVLPERVRLRRSGLTTLCYRIIQAGSVGRVVTHGPGWLVVDFNGALVKVARSDDRLEVLA